MRRSLNALLFGSGFLLLSMAAYAQSSYPYYRNYPDDRNYSNRGGYDDRYYQDQNRYGNDRYNYGGGYQDALIGRVLADLDRAAYGARLDGHERKHFDEAAQKLQEFQGRLAQGRFDNSKLDKAIENLAHLADADRVRGRDRDMLARDLQDLRQYRSSRGRYSNYGDGYYRQDRYDQNRRYDPNWR
jgi:hypothetical protein